MYNKLHTKGWFYVIMHWYRQILYRIVKNKIWFGKFVRFNVCLIHISFIRTIRLVQCVNLYQKIHNNNDCFTIKDSIIKCFNIKVCDKFINRLNM